MALTQSSSRVRSWHFRKSGPATTQSTPILLYEWCIHLSEIVMTATVTWWKWRMFRMQRWLLPYPRLFIKHIPSRLNNTNAAIDNDIIHVYLFVVDRVSFIIIFIQYVYYYYCRALHITGVGGVRSSWLSSATRSAGAKTFNPCATCGLSFTTEDYVYVKLTYWAFYLGCHTIWLIYIWRYIQHVGISSSPLQFWPLTMMHLN